MTDVYLLFQLILLTWYKQCSLLQSLRCELRWVIPYHSPSSTALPHAATELPSWTTPAIKLDTGLEPVQSALPIYIITACTVMLSLK